MVGVLRCFTEEILFSADGGGQRGHQLFTDGIQRRIGDLGEKLFEIIVKQPGPAGKNGQGDVVPHGTGGLLPVPSHGGQNHADLFRGVAEQLLQG